MLIEDEDVEVPAWHALVGRHFCRDRPHGRLGIDACGFLHVLEQQQGARPPVLDDLDLAGLQIGDRVSGSVRHAHVEAHDVHAGSEHVWRVLLGERG
jgi:hypothetical protein